MLNEKNLCQKHWALECIRIRAESENDWNTLRVDADIFKSGKKKLRIQKFPGTCGRGLKEATLLAGREHGERTQENSDFRLFTEVKFC